MTSKHLPYKLIYIIFLSILCLSGIYFILENPEWIFGDDIEWLRTTAIGLTEPMAVHMQMGRFVPLGHYDYNLLPFVFHATSVQAHYIWVALSFVLFVFFMGKLLYQASLQASQNRAYLLLSGLAFSVLLLRGETVMLFMSVIYPERILTLMLCFFMYFLFQAQKTQQTKYYILAFFSAVYATYCKEPVFGALVIIALTNLLFNYKQLPLKQKTFNALLILNGAIFLGLYYWIVLRQTSDFYNSGKATDLSYPKIFVIMLQSMKFYYLIFAFAIYQGIAVLFCKERNNLYYDSLLFASAGYFLAFNFIKFYQSYYLFPGAVLALPAIAYYSVKLSQLKKYILAILVLLLIVTTNSENDGVKRRLWQYRTQRAEDMSKYQDIANIIKQGGKVYWYQPQNQYPEYEKYKNYLEWRETISETFLNYLLKSVNQNYLHLTSTHTQIQPKDVLLYSVEYSQELTGKKFLEKIEESSWLKNVDRVGGITIYKKIFIQPLPLNSEVKFTEEKYFQLNGFSENENGGRWTTQTDASIKVNIAQKDLKGIKLIFDVMPFVNEKQPTLISDIYIGNEKITSWKFDWGRKKSYQELYIKPKFIRKNKPLKISFHFSNSKSPKALGIGKDRRKLNLHFKSIRAEGL